MQKNLILFFLLINCYSSFSQSFSIILGRPTASSITAHVVFDRDVDFFIEYGLDELSLNNTITLSRAKANVPQVVEFVKLNKNSKYYYTIQYKLPNATNFSKSPLYSFQTQRGVNESFSFTIEADEHLYDKKGHAPLYEICLANQAKDLPDFMISLGDTFGDDHTPDETTSEDMKALHEDYLKYLGKITHSIPFFFCLGNHEGENGYYLKQNNGENIAVYGTQWRKYYYPNPFPNEFYSGNMKQEAYGIGSPENYYAFTWGNVLFVILDVYRDCDVNEKPQKWDWTLGKNQYDWFRKTLEESSAKFKFVFAHHTRGQGRGGAITAEGYEWGGYNNTRYEFDEQRPGWGKPIHQLMKDAGVTIFFQGHDHLYAKENVNGIIYQEVPMPSDSSYSIGITANGDAYTDVILDGSGHLRVDVHPNCVQVDYVKAYLPKDTISMHKNREVAYSYTVGDCALKSIDLSEDLIKIFPNPTQDNFTIFHTSDVDFSNCEISMIDSKGKEFLPKRKVIETGNIQIYTNDLPKGIYFIRIQTPQTKPIVKKIIIQ